MPDTLNDRIERQEALAEAATPGRWKAWLMEADENGYIWRDKAVVSHNNGKTDLGIVYTVDWKNTEQENSDAAHIAANDPATIKAFCAVAKAAWTAKCVYCACKFNSAHCVGEPCCPSRRAECAALAALYDALGKGVE